jgi:hypothetical protein
MNRLTAAQHCERIFRIVAFFAVYVVSSVVRAPSAAAQDPTVADRQDTARVIVDTTRAGTGWDSPRVRELITRASHRRAEPRADTSLHNYRATAEGFLYFFLDRRSSEERTLVRVNQIGLELYWMQPDIARQRIAGMRDASPLPNTMRYHIDHLTMVQNGFGDVIRMGDGDEVRDVVHPVSARGASIYEYRLADSTEVRVPSMPQPIQVYEVQVRPRRVDRPGFVGSVFINRQTADVTRMTFTFTPSSYVDKRLDYINLTLDNALWEGKYWLPNEQTVEIRRQLPELDFVAGSVIRGRMHILDYQLNAAIPDSIFQTSRPVISAAPEDLANYKFEMGLFDDVAQSGLAQTAEAAGLRREAAELIGARFMSGLPALRLYYPDVSSAIRYNRTEGLNLGLGATYSHGPPWRYDAAVGYAFGSQRVSTLGRITYAPSATSLSLAGYTHALRDLGPVTPLAGIANSLAGLVLGKDYTDPWYATGAAFVASRPLTESLRVGATLRAERQTGATLTQTHAPFDHDADFRAVRAIDGGDEYSLLLSLDRPQPTQGIVAWGASLALRGAQFNAADSGFDDGTYAKAQLSGDLLIRPASHAREFRSKLAFAAMTSGAPVQQYFAIGGTGTLPGFAYRTFTGRTGALATAEYSQRVAYPWLGIRALGSVGVAGHKSFTPALSTWSTTSSDGPRASVGAGVSLFWDLLHVDVVKGINGGRWVTQISFTNILNDIS